MPLPSQSGSASRRRGLLGFGIALVSAACAATPETTPAELAARERDRVFAELLERYERDGDGRIGRAEYGRDEAGFENLDRDGDTLVTRADFDVPLAMPADLTSPMLLMRAFGVPGEAGVTLEHIEAAFPAHDADADGRLARAEFFAIPAVQGGNPDTDRYATLLAAADVPPAGDGDGQLALSELSAYFARRDVDGDGVLVPRERMLPGPEPAIGWFERGAREIAPDFTAAAPEGDGSVSLASLRGRPVALVFGSFT